METVMRQLQSIFTQISFLDVIIILVLIFYAIEGYAVGFTISFLDSISFFLALLAALKWYAWAGAILVTLTHTPKEIASPLGFLLVAILVETCLRLIRTFVLQKLMKFSWVLPSPLYLLDKLLGIAFGITTGTILLSFLLTFLSVLPIGPELKSAINTSRISQILISSAQGMQGLLEQGVGHTPTDLLTFFTVEPQDGTSVPLGFTVPQGIVNAAEEARMVRLVNDERQKDGLNSVSVDDSLTKLARSHAEDMLARGYFAHNTPEGLTPFDRMNGAGITYQFAGENLAFSQTTDLAMSGLMNSPGHRANILNVHYNKIGVGVIDAGLYGKMFVQEFTD